MVLWLPFTFSKSPRRSASTSPSTTLSLEVPAGVVYGFIGPNGSGKTTTLRMIMRILHPDAGEIRVLGETSLGAANDRVGYLPEERGLYKQMKVREVSAVLCRAEGVSQEQGHD